MIEESSLMSFKVIGLPLIAPLLPAAVSASAQASAGQAHRTASRKPDLKFGRLYN